MPLLLTTFAPWRAHQPSNAAHDLRLALERGGHLPPRTVVLPPLPVNFDLAPIQVIAKVAELRPPVVVCCGMAETRTALSLERYGHGPHRRWETTLDLAALQSGTYLTTTSDDAGTYVCNHLYYRLLAAIAHHRWPCHGLFVHVPPPTADTLPLLVHDLALVLARLAVYPRPAP